MPEIIKADAGDTSQVPAEIPAEVLQAPVTIKVNGRDRQMPLQQALEQMRKGVAAEERFQEAADLKHQAEQAMQVQSALRAGLKDPASLRAALRGAGWPDDVIDASLAAGGAPISGDDDDDSEETPPARRAAPVQPKPLRREDLPLEYQEMAVKYEEAKREANRRQYQGQIDLVIDNDPDFAKIMVGKSAKTQAWLRHQAYQEVGRQAAGRQWGPQVIEQGLSSWSTALKEAGIPLGSANSGPSITDVVDTRSLAATGLTADPNELSRLIASEEKDIPHMDDPNYSKSFFASMARHHAKTVQKQRQ